ncbi:hypothetical protein ACQKNB_14195 [Lysinibacillus xylanilyticus]|uniref:hypothetical protein n=1 Tax=Lysinibacillus xylanilyticus TaxID=582475 RepID=UPI003D08488A
MVVYNNSIAILGSCGGVAKAVLAILNNPNLKNQLVIHQFDLINQVALMEHFKKTNTTVVMDVSWADTVEVMKCCNNLGINYVNTALENPFIDGFFYLHSR